MPAAARLGDYCTGHDACAPSPLVECSPDVNINGRGAARVNDMCGSHGCHSHGSHQDIISTGSSTVFINGLPAARVGDSVAPAGSVRDGSDNVFIS